MNARSSMVSIALIALLIVIVTYFVASKPPGVDLNLSENTKTRDTEKSIMKAADQLYEVLAEENANAMSDIQKQILILTTQLDHLQSKLQGIQKSQSSTEQKSVNGNTLSNEGTDLNTAEQEAEARRETYEQITAINDNFQAEMTDPGWSTTAESRLQDAFDNQLLAEHHLQDMECRTSMCRLDILHQDGSNMTNFRHNLRDQVSDILPAGAIHPGDDGNSTVVYLAKDSDSLVTMTTNGR